MGRPGTSPQAKCFSFAKVGEAQVLTSSFEIPRFVRDACEGVCEIGQIARVLRADSGRLLLRTVETLQLEVLVPLGSEACVAGDWVELDLASQLVRRIPRRNVLSRRAAGRREEAQVIAANIDLVLIVMSLDADFSVRRIERYLTLTYEAQASPIVLLTKAASCPNVAAHLAQVQAIARGVPIHAIDVLSGLNADVPARCLPQGATAVLVGSSGVGKSTLLNHLIENGERVPTQAVRERDSKGRHTTSWRELRYLAHGAAVIDTPGMREVQLWAGSEALAATFDDVSALSGACRYRDCRHETEPGCGLRLAVAEGELSNERLQSFLQLRGEVDKRPAASANVETERRAHERTQARAVRARLKDKRGADD